MKFDVIEVSALGGAIVPVTKSRQATVKKWAKKVGVPVQHVKTIPGFAGTYIDTEAMHLNAWDFVDKYEGKIVRENPVKHYPVKLLMVKRFIKGNLMGMESSDSLGFTSEKSALEWVNAINSKRGKNAPNYKIVSYEIVRTNPAKRKAAPKRKATPKKVTAKKCACKVMPRKKGQRLPWVIGVLNGQQKGYFTGDGFDTNPSAALLFVSETHAKRIGKQIRGLPRGAKLFITKKPYGAVGAPIIQ